MAWFRRCTSAVPRSGSTRLTVEGLERRLAPASADLTIYRPVTDYFGYANHRVAEAHEESHSLGAGIRINGDDDDGNGVADYSDAAAGATENDLIRVDVAATGAAALAYSDHLRVWTSATKAALVNSGDTVGSGTYWVEYVGLAHTSEAAPATLTLSAVDESGAASDLLVLHSFQSIVVAIGGNTQDPARVGDPALGTFTVASTLYQQGYDVHMYRHDQISSTGAGAAYNEVVSAISARNVENVAIFGYSWGGGATYELAKGLKNHTAIQGQYSLRYTASIDGIRHGSISSERRVPPGTAYHDNIYQRRDWLLKGNSVTGAKNLNVTNTSWGKKLNHTGIDDHPRLQNLLVTNLTSRVVR